MPSDVATAYVQIIPSAKGIGSGIAEALGGDKAAASTGENLGKSLGSKLVDTLKGVIAAAGLGAALGKTLTEGGALEQSIGGVETLFKDSADQVIAAADRAFTTAGVCRPCGMALLPPKTRPKLRGTMPPAVLNSPSRQPTITALPHWKLTQTATCS